MGGVLGGGWRSRKVHRSKDEGLEKWMKGQKGGKMEGKVDGGHKRWMEVTRDA